VTRLLARQQLEFFSLFAHPPLTSGPALRPTQPPIRWVLGALSLEIKRPEREAKRHLYLPPRLIIRGAIPQLIHTSPWRGTQLSPGTNIPLPDVLL